VHLAADQQFLQPGCHTTKVPYEHLGIFCTKALSSKHTNPEQPKMNSALAEDRAQQAPSTHNGKDATLGNDMSEERVSSEHPGSSELPHTIQTNGLAVRD
jgi:hypothetical protein